MIIASNDNIVGYWNAIRVQVISYMISLVMTHNNLRGTIFGATWSNNTIAKSIYVSISGSDENGDGDINSWGLGILTLPLEETEKVLIMQMMAIQYL